MICRARDVKQDIHDQFIRLLFHVVSDRLADDGSRQKSK